MLWVFADVRHVVFQDPMPGGIQQHCHAAREKLRHRSRRTIRKRKLTIRVTQKAILVVVGRLEGGVHCGLVETAAVHFHTQGFELLVEVAEPATLGRSSKGIGHRIKPKNRPMPLKIGGPNGVALLVRHALHGW